MDEAEIMRLAEELHTEVRYLTHDPSPHAPEIPYYLQRPLEKLFATFGMAYPK